MSYASDARNLGLADGDMDPTASVRADQAGEDGESASPEAAAAIVS